MTFCLALFVGAVIYGLKKVSYSLEFAADEATSQVINRHEDLLEKRNQILQERSQLEHSAREIFILYEMTREITKKLNEEEAFEIFKEKLKENIVFEDCQFIDALSSEHEIHILSERHFVFPLQEKNRKLGYLVVKGLSAKDKDKLAILGHQFALALRRVKLYQEIEESAITDSLTGVHTRRYFLERFEEELKRSITRKINLSFLMIDVDHFKSFNDKYGHLVGDQILRTIGGIVKDNIREIDIVGRYGGEELTVVLPDTDQDGAQFAAERIRSAVAGENIKAYDANVKVTVSIGVSTFPSDGKLVAELIDKADWALYRAKKKGRNCICTFGLY